MGLSADTSASLGMAGSAIGGLGKAYGALSTASALSKAGLYQAAILRQNADLALRNADLEMATGGAAAQRQELKTQQQVGAIEAAQGASNVDVGSGSAPRVRAGQAEVGTLDAMTELSNAARRAYGFDVQAQGFGEEATLATREASQARTAGTVEALGSLIGGASSVANQYAKWKALAGTGNQVQQPLNAPAPDFFGE